MAKFANVSGNSVAAEMTKVYQQNGYWMVDASVFGKRIRRNLIAKNRADAEDEARSILAGGLTKRHREDRYSQQDMKELYWKASHHAKQRGLLWALSFDDLVEMFERSHHRCEISGIPFDRHYRPEGASKRPFCASIDRIANSDGYSPDNCRLVCTIVNVAMGEWGFEAMQTLSNALSLRRRQPRLVI